MLPNTSLSAVFSAKKCIKYQVNCDTSFKRNIAKKENATE